MIPTATLQDWKRLLAKAAPPPVIVAAMDQKGTKFQLQTPRPMAKIVGTVFDKANAEFLAACYLAVPHLIAEVENARASAEHYRRLAAAAVQDARDPSDGELLEKGIPPHRRTVIDGDPESVQRGRRKLR